MCARACEAKPKIQVKTPTGTFQHRAKSIQEVKGPKKTVETLRNVCHQQRRPKPNIEVKTPTKNIPLQGQDYLRNKGVEDPF